MLYIVGTSIGNIKDTSLRAVETLTQADIILSEDTRTFGEYYLRIKQMYRLDSKEQDIIAYHDQNEFQMLPRVMRILAAGKSVALVSESGMPVISDPGSLLVKRAIKEGYEISVIPGPTAFATAMAYTGDPINIAYVGFLSKKDSQIRKLIEASQSFVAYESPHRIMKTLELLDKLAPTADVTICRELTKKFETIYHGTPSELLENTYKGEITLVVRLS